MPLIEATARELDLDTQRVKKFLKNRLLGKKIPYKPGKRITTRPSSNFNVFCSRTKLPQTGWTEKMSQWRQMWANLTEDEKKSYTAQPVPVESYTDKELSNRVGFHFKRIKQECEIIQDLGCELVMFGISKEGRIRTTGTDKGQEWLAQNSNILDEFHVFLGKKSLVQQPGPENLNIGDKSQLEEDVRKMMDKKYSAVAKYRTKFPYKAASRGDVEILGVPAECQPLVPPSRYTAHKLALLLQSESDITVKILKVPSRKTKTATTPEIAAGSSNSDSVLHAGDADASSGDAPRTEGIVPTPMEVDAIASIHTGAVGNSDDKVGSVEVSKKTLNMDTKKMTNRKKRKIGTSVEIVASNSSSDSVVSAGTKETDASSSFAPRVEGIVPAPIEIDAIDDAIDGGRVEPEVDKPQKSTNVNKKKKKIHICNECNIVMYSRKDFKVNEEWIQCEKCNEWWHVSCAEKAGSYDKLYFYCGICKPMKKK